MKVLKLDSCKSTNDILKKLNNIDAVLSSRQSKGRGQRENVFFSPQGGLYLSIKIFPSFSLDKLKFLAFRTGLVVKDILKENYKIDIKLKYINDLVLNNKKLGGILIENNFIDGKLDFSVIGIGINVYNLEKVDSSLEKIYTHLNIKDYKNFIEDIYPKLILKIKALENDFSVDDLITAYNFSLFKKNQRVDIRLNKENEIQNLKIIGIDTDANLIFEKNKSIKIYSYGQFNFIDIYK